MLLMLPEIKRRKSDHSLHLVPRLLNEQGYIFKPIGLLSVFWDFTFKVKSKFIPEQAMKTQRGSRSLDLHLL
jgi:hypothetical protein